MSAGAPEAERLIELGLVEGPRNTHPGQGTANRRFFFANGMLELIWVADEAEAQSEMARPTLLSERWSKHTSGASPFGVILRPGDGDATPPFAGWNYSPPYFGGSRGLHIANTGIEEPMWAYFNIAHRRDYEQRFVEHPAGFREITGFALESPTALWSDAARNLTQSGVLNVREGAAHLLEIEFDRAWRGEAWDLRPLLPLRLLI